ncbi:MAG: gliding motility protein GldN [Muribaculaceae bacterium]|nr:gliding motility protein GldN [Muribaculaceae bacterium]MDE6321222.1 gliding motility protein GldN [Muribaculaceae bacterium]
MMKTINRYIITAVSLVAIALGAAAQESSSSAVMRRGGTDRNSRRNSTEAAGPQVTQRMEGLYEQTPVSDADMEWMRVIYRQIDLNDDKNAPLYYPEDLVDGQENLFRIIMRLVANNQVPAYEYLDGREIFTDQYKVKVRDMLDRFYILYTEAKGSTEKNPKFTIEESDVPANEVLTYYILERWEFDKLTNRMRTRVEAICPVLHRSGDWGGDAVKYPMFWVKMDNLRPYLAQQEIFTTDDNNLATTTYDDFFANNMYKGEIYKTRNLKNKSMAQLYPDPDDLKRAQDSIQNRLDTYEANLWVPSREELAAKREAEALAAAKAKEEADAVASRDDDGDAIEAVTEEKPVRSARSSRGKTSTADKKKDSKKKEPKKIKEPKQQKGNSNNAVRSVRRRK